MKKGTKIIIALVFLILLGLIIKLYYKYTPNDLKNIFNISTLIGLYISLYGFFIAIYQIIAIKNTTAETQKAIKETRTKIDHLLSLADCSKSIATI